MSFQWQSSPFTGKSVNQLYRVIVYLIAHLFVYLAWPYKTGKALLFIWHSFDELTIADLFVQFNSLTVTLIGYLGK